MPPGIALFLVAARIIPTKQEDRVQKESGYRETRGPPEPKPPIPIRIEQGSSKQSLDSRLPLRGTPPHSDLVVPSAPAPPCSSTISSTSPNATSTVESLDADSTRMDDLERDEVLRLLGGVDKSTEEGPGTRKRVQSGRTGNRASRIGNHLASEPVVKPKAPAARTSTEPDKPYVYRGSRIGKMLALSTYAQAVLPEESKRLSALEAFVARASEVGLSDRPGEFDGQLVREITGLREVTNPIGFDPETKKTLELAEELSRDLLAFREKYGAGNSFVPTGRRERTAREAAATARQRMTGESDNED
ncbi:hypothetical protein FRC00_013571 [Tulasnella sp. 408]|nr:hypothetical protein FRC00_013571 [Tulasnella sp. 408]